MVFHRPTGDSSAAARGEITMSRIIVLMILANRLLIVFISTSAKIGGPSSFLLPVAETVFDIGDEADQRDAEKSQKHDGDEGHLQGIGFEVDEVAETFGGHEKLSDDDVDDGAADAGAQSGENVGVEDGRVMVKNIWRFVAERLLPTRR